MKKNTFLLAVFSFLFYYGISAGEIRDVNSVKLRVAVFRGTDIVISSRGPLIVSGAGNISKIPQPGKIKFEFRNGRLFVDGKANGTEPVLIETNGNDKISIRDKLYRGELEVRLEEDNFVVINELPLEAYLFSVVASEISPSWPLEALKAQAIAARTYALYYRIKNRDKTYHLESSEYSQVYSGANSEDKRVDKAILSTSGLVMTYKGDLIQTFFHSCCGGRTEDISAVWPDTNLPYLRSKICSFCRESKRYKWEFVISKNDLEKILSTEKRFSGKISLLRPKNYTRTERVSELVIRISNRYEKLSASDFRMWLGSNRIPSTLFKVNYRGENFIFSGRGFGHGLGMCQEGAKNMAEKRYMYGRILKFYFPGIKIEKYRGKLER